VIKFIILKNVDSILEPTSGFRHTKKIVGLITILVIGRRDYSPLPRTPATIPIMNTAARTNSPSAKKLKAVPVLFSTFVNEVDRTDLVIDGMELSMLATTTSPTIIVTAAITTVRMRETMSIPPSAFLNIFHLHLHWLMIYMSSIYKGY